MSSCLPFVLINQSYKPLKVTYDISFPHQTQTSDEGYVTKRARAGKCYQTEGGKSPESQSSWSEGPWPPSQLFLVNALKQIPRVRWFPHWILPRRKRPDRRGVIRCVRLCVCINSPILTFYLIGVDGQRAQGPALQRPCCTLETLLTAELILSSSKATCTLKSSRPVLSFSNTHWFVFGDI